MTSVILTKNLFIFFNKFFIFINFPDKNLTGELPVVTEAVVGLAVVPLTLTLDLMQGQGRILPDLVAGQQGRVVMVQQVAQSSPIGEGNCEIIHFHAVVGTDRTTPLEQ